MIGKVCLSVVDFYDVQCGATRRKTRPVLVIGGPSENDYSVLPISTITRQANRNPSYDIPILPPALEALHLNRPCFIRTHKQMPLHRGALLKEIGDMRQDAPELYREAVTRMAAYQRELVRRSM